MNLARAYILCKLGIAFGLILVAVGTVPVAMGLHDVNITGMSLSQGALDGLRSQPGGQTLVDCAMASVGLANQGAEAYNYLARVGRIQSLVLIAGGFLVMLSYVCLLRFLPKVNE